MSACPLTVVMPVYNEEPVIATVLADVTRNVLDLVPGSELIVIDDCSTDGTAALLAEASAADQRISVRRNAANSGHGISVRNGFGAAHGDWIFQIDSDGQVELDQFAGFWAARDDADLVMGMRVRRNDPLHRLVLTRVTRLVVSVLARRRLRDANVPFKLVRRDLFEHLSPLIPANAFAPSIMLALGAARSGARITELEIRHLPRPHGKSTIRVFRLARACSLSFRQTVRFGAAKVPPYHSG